MKNILMSMVFVVVAFCATNAWAGSSQTVNLNAIVPVQTGGLSVVIHQVTGTTFSPNTSASINFGTLTWDSVNSIFTTNGGFYYAMDIGVVDNSGTVWTLTHARQSFKKDATNNLDSHINVSFDKVHNVSGAPDVDVLLQKLSFASSNNITYTKTQLASGSTPGWLRIYYGLGTGDSLKPDATGVTPIGLDTPAGTYTGSVTITLAP